MKTRKSLIIVMLAALTMSIAALFFGFQPNTTAHAETTISNTTITADTTWVADTKLSGNIVIKSGVTVTLTGNVSVKQYNSVVISGGGTIKRGNEEAYLNLPGKTNFTLNNVTLDGAKIAAKQPMIFNANSDASLTIKNCTIKDCITTDSQAGGVIRLWKTSLNIDNTTITGCSGKNYGSIYAKGEGADYASVSISNSKFYNNSATGARYSSANGGAIYLYKTNTEITNCEFRNNFTQNGSGGAIVVSESTLTLNSGIFTDNVADDLYEDSYSGNGGAISISGSSSVVNVYGGYFLNNKSKGALSDIYTYSNATLNVNLKNLPTREGYTFSGWTDSEGNTYPVSQFTVTGKNTNLVAKWDANKYKISYSGMDKATLSPKPEQHTYGTDTKIANPTKTGYTFNGWKVNGSSTAVKNLTLGATAYKSDISLEATWTVNQYQVTLDRQGGNGGTASVTATYKSEMPAIEKLPTRTGYTFQGYFAKPKGAGKRYYDKNGNSAATCDFYAATTLYAHWQANTYTIQYMQNKPSKASNEVAGSTASSSHTYDQSKALTANGYSLTGWHFCGWAKTATGLAEYTDGASVKNLTSANGSTVILYAVWQANTYKIVYNSNKPEVAGSTAASSHTYDTPQNLTANGYSLTGWHFCGWAKTANGAAEYTNGEEVKNLTSANGGTVTLYTVWQANTYTIKYMQNKPSKASHEVAGSTAASSHTYDQSKALTASGYSLTGWHFCGWAETENGEVKYTDGASVKNLTSANGGAVTLYAVWQANTYTIVYNSNTPKTASGSITETMPQVTHTYDTAKNLSDNQFTLTGWHFCGWAKTANGAAEYTNGQKINNLTDKDGGTVTLYAVWQANTYTIKFNTDGGNFVQETSATFDSVLPNAGVPARKGYRFCGYYSQAGGKGVQFYDASGKAAENKTYAEDRNIELYAYWSVISYNIDLYSGGRYVKTLENVAFDHLRLPSAAALSLSREHYNFVGWNLYDNQDWKMFSADVVYTVGIGYEQGETVTLYAAWKEKNVYSVNYDANGGGGAPGVEQKHEDETFALSDTIPTRENYTFLGWARTPDANLADYPAGFVNKLTMGGEPITLYAVWKRNPSLSFDANGGAFSSAPEIRYPAAGSEEGIPSAAPEKAGHIFAGWSNEKDASIADYPADGSKKITMPDADTLLYAVWQKQKYTITHAVASSDFEIVGLLGEYEYESAATFTIQTAASATGKPIVYVNGELLAAKNGEYTFTVRGESHVFVAAADGSALTLVYSANGGTGAPYDNNVYKSGDTVTIPPATPTRCGYTFLGWAAEQNAEVAQYKKGETYTFAGASAVLYAVWKANAYTVVYNANGGAGDMQNGEFTFGTKGALAKNSFAKIGYTFVGWTLSQNGAAAYKDGAEIADLCADENGTVTLYAVWEQTVTQISFDAEGGKENNGTFSVAYGEELTGEKLAFPTRSGYKFAGYFTQRGGAGEEIFDAALNAVVSGGWNKNLTALTLYAGWQPISYTIVYMNGADKVKSQTAVYDTKFNLLTAAELAITPEKYHHFAGWTTAPSGQVVMYADGQEISGPLSATDGEEVIFYAVFAENEKYSVHYNANGGSNAPVDATTYYAGETVTFSTVKPEKEGYNFQGWRFDPNGGNLLGAEVTMQEGGITLYAVWQAGETLTAQINAVKVAHDSLQEAFNDLNNTVTAKDGLSDKIADLLTRMNAAESLLDTLNNTTIAALRTEIANLKSTLEAADKSLGDRISAVESSLSGALDSIKNLTNGKANQSDFEELEKAFNAANTLLSGQVADLLTKYNTLNGTVTDLKSSYESLQSSYDNLSQKLTDEIQKVTDTINAKVKELSDGKADKTALDALDEAYKAADTILKGELENRLAEKDAALKGEIAKLKVSYAAADTALQEKISDVQRQLNEAVQNISDLIGQKADQSDFTSLKEAFDAAKTLLDSEIETRGEKDAKLEAKIAALQFSYDTLSQKLTKEIQKVTDTIQAKVTELTEKKADKTALTELKKAFDDANTLLSGQVADLFSEHDILNGRVASLETTYNLAITELRQQISDLNTQLTAAVSNLTNKKADKTALDALDQNLTEAKRLLNLDVKGLQDEDAALKGELAALKGELENLKVSYAAADTALQEKINDVQRQLNEAAQKISDLNGQKANQSDFASLKESFESAEALLNSEIAARTNKDDSLDMKDAELEAKIADLTNAFHTAQSALETKINEVTRRLDEAIRDLNASIASNASNVEEKLAAAKRAYEAADVVICGEIALLKDKDTELSGQISALELSCKAADEALWAGIRQVQENLESLRAGMESKNNELGNDIDSVGAENERLIFLNVVFYVVLGVTVLTSVLVSKVRKPLKKHRK